MKPNLRNLIVMLLILCMVLNNSITAFANTKEILDSLNSTKNNLYESYETTPSMQSTSNDDTEKELLWSTSFEEATGFTANHVDEKGSQNLKPVSSNALVGDITYLVDLGTIGGSADYNVSETKNTLFDHTSTTKFLTNVGAPTIQAPVTVRWSFNEKVEKAVNQYAMVSANDSASRDPKSWKLYGKNENDEEWTLIDERNNEIFAARYEQKLYTVSTPKAYSSYIINITENYGNGNMTQFADIILATGNTEDDESQESGMYVDISKGPTSTWNQNANAGWSGSKALKVTGSISAENAYSYNVIYDGLALPVEDTTYLEYCIFPAMSNGNTYDFQYTQMYLAVDLKFTDGTYLSELNALDQNNNGLDAISQGNSKTLTTNQWNQIYGSIGTVAKGKIIDKVMVVYNKPTHDMTGLKDFTTFFDDLAIYNKGEVKYDHLSSYTNILRGTNDTPGFSRGLTAPAVTMPHGFNFWAPATNTGDNKIYDYQDTTLRFITTSHEPSYWIGDRGTWQLMVNTSIDVSTASSFGLGTLTSDFSHENEVANAHYYSVEFDKTKGASKGSQLELTPTDHGAVVRFTFDESVANRNVMFDCVRANGGVTFDSTSDVTTFQGYSDHMSNGSKRMYVYGTFNAKAVLTKTSNKAGIAKFSEDVVELKIATSYLSYEQAQRNLELEIMADDDFDDIYNKAQSTWDEKLGIISNVKGASYEQLVTLYSNMYRLLAYPNAMSENTGTSSEPVWKYKSPYRNADAEPVEGQIYINNGFWDTYRTTWAAYGLLTPSDATVMLNGLVQHYNDQDWVPRWIAPGGTNSMVGTSSDVIFADALVKGIDFDYEAAYQSAIRNAATVSSNLTNGGRKNLANSIFLGYTPGSAEDFSWSIEGYINDYGISQMAEVLALQEIDEVKKEQYLADYQYYLNRAKNYVKLFDGTGETYADQWFKGKTSSSEWVTSNYTEDQFDPFYWGSSYTETNAYNMAVSATQDGQGLANLYGGLDNLGNKLDSIFTTDGIYNGYGAINGVGGIHEQKEAREVKLGQYGHNNQPSHHIIYMYNYAAQPWKAQEYARDVLDRCYVGSTFGQGYIGDEDNGEMSAWYIFSALGFYPVNMGSDEYAIGSPLFEEVTVNLENGKTLTIIANNNSKENVYIQSMKLNGENYTKSFLKNSDICNGGIIEFTMGSEPNKAWGTGNNDLPGSITAAGEKVLAYDDITNPKVKTVIADSITTNMVFEDCMTSAVTGSAILIDNTSSTELGLNDGATIYYSLDKGKRAELFTITSGKTGLAPSSISLYGAYEEGDWIKLAAYDDLEFKWSQYTRPFRISEELQGDYAHYKFVFGQGTVSEIELLSYDDGIRNRDDLGKLIQVSLQIDQADMITVLKEKLNGAILDAVAVYDVTTGTDDYYTNGYKVLKRVIEMVTGDLISAYERMEAEEFDAGNVLIDMVGGVPHNIGGVQKNYWACYKNILFKGDTNYVELNYAAQASDAGGYVEIYLDDKNSEPVGVIQTPVTGSGWSNYITAKAALSPTITGLHDVYLIFRNNGTQPYVANVDWFRFDVRSMVNATASEHGSIDFISKEVGYGESVTFHIDPDDGYVIDQVLVNENDVGFKGNKDELVSYTLNGIIQNTTIFVSFKPIPTGSATAIQVEGATITFRDETNITDVEIGTVVIADITVVSGSAITCILVNDKELEPSHITKNLDGSYTITFVMVEGINAITVEVSKIPDATVTSIEIISQPTKLIYDLQEPLDFSGMEIVATYSDNTTAIVHMYQVVTQNPTSTVGDVTITIEYEGAITSYQITVKEKVLPVVTISKLEITKKPNKLVYQVGENLDLSGMEVVATYSDDTTAIINSYQVVTQNPTSTAGTVTIAISYEGLTANYEITVNNITPVTPTPVTPAPSVPIVSRLKLEITKNPNKLVYQVGEPLDVTGMEVTIIYSDGTTAVTRDYTVTTINATSTIGETKVTISYNGLSASYFIHVNLLAKAITLNVSKKTLVVGNSFKIIPTLSPIDTTSTVLYDSSNPSVAVVNAEGIVTAKAVGTTQITAITDNGLKAICKITVRIDPKSIKLSLSKKTLGIGEKLTLTHTISPKNADNKVTYSSSKKSVATISAAGIITAKKIGTTKITVKTVNGKTASCTITVKKAPTSVDLSVKALTLKVKKTAKLKVTLSKNSAGSVSYQSSNKSVATVDKNGKITGLKVGTTMITVTTYNGKIVRIKVTIKK